MYNVLLEAIHQLAHYYCLNERISFLSLLPGMSSPMFFYNYDNVISRIFVVRSCPTSIDCVGRYVVSCRGEEYIGWKHRLGLFLPSINTPRIQYASVQRRRPWPRRPVNVNHGGHARQGKCWSRPTAMPDRACCRS